MWRICCASQEFFQVITVLCRYPSRDASKKERKRFTALYFIYVSQNCLCRDGDLGRKEAKQQTALSGSFHCGDTAVAVLLLVSIQRFKNEVFPLVVLVFLL